MLAYSLGLAVPFLLSALMIDRFMTLFRRRRGALVWIARASGVLSGVLLIAVGLLMVTGSMTVLSAGLQRCTPEFLRSRL
jgi:cytochrome c-type biogenesis protein